MKLPRFGLFRKSATRTIHHHHSNGDKPVSGGRRRHSKTVTTTKSKPRKRSITYYASANKTRLYPPELFPAPPLGVSSMRRSSTGTGGGSNYNNHPNNGGVAAMAPITHTKLVPLRANIGGDGRHDIVWVPEHQIIDVGLQHSQYGIQRATAGAGERIGAPFIPTKAIASSSSFVQSGRSSAIQMGQPTRLYDSNANGAVLNLNTKQQQQQYQYQRQPILTSAIVPYGSDMSSSLLNVNYNNGNSLTNCLNNQMVVGEWAQQPQIHRQHRGGLAIGSHGINGSGSGGFGVGGIGTNGTRLGIRHRRKKVFLYFYFFFENNCLLLKMDEHPPRMPDLAKP